MSEILAVKDLSKQFPGVKAVDSLSLSMEKGEVLAIIGENGAGKSTLTKMLCGVHKPTSGTMYLEGKEISFHSPFDAMKCGIAMVYQELAVTPGMSVAENIFMHRQPTNKLGIIKKHVMNKAAKEYLDMFSMDVDPSTLIKRLSLGQQQIIEILKAVSLHPKVLILDEPTSSLTETEAARLFEIIAKLKGEGFSFIYISHKFSEIFKVADRVMVMRDGMHIGTKPVNEVTEAELIRMMVGRELSDLYSSHAKAGDIAEEFFRVEDISAVGLFKHVSFSLRRGEILGFAGLIGAGRTEMACGIVGLEKLQSGKLYLHGSEIQNNSTKDAIKNGIGYITEDRKKLGLFVNFPVADNLIAPSLGQFKKYGLIQRTRTEKFADEQIKRFNITTTSRQQKMLNLSGGNQQKCLLAMWMSKDPKLLIFDEPTRGVDVGAKAEIYEKIKEYVSGGSGAIVISSDLPELIGICDRIVVMYQGRVQGELKKADFSEEAIMLLASGNSGRSA